MKMKKCLYALFAAAAITSFCIPTVSAEPVPDTVLTDDDLVVDVTGSDTGESFLPEKDMVSSIDHETYGSITIQLADGKAGTSKEKITFECVKVADIVDGEYRLLDAYASLDVDLNAINNANELKAAAEKIESVKKHSAVVSIMTDANGKAEIDGLGVGVYALLAKGNEKYDEIEPTLIALPTWSETDGTMLYDLQVEPKHSPRPDTPTKKVPQTNLMDNTYVYVIGAAICLIIAGVVIYTRKQGDKKKKA